MKKRYAFLFALMAFTLFIFLRSLKNAEDSTNESRWIVDFVMAIVEKFIKLEPQTLNDIVTIVVRKLAHIAEYTVHALIMCGLFSTFPGHIRKNIPCIMFVGLFTACTDEAIQLASVGRAGMIEDVFVDFAGTLLGIAISLALVYLWGKIKKLNIVS